MFKISVKYPKCKEKTGPAKIPCLLSEITRDSIDPKLKIKRINYLITLNKRYKWDSDSSARTKIDKAKEKVRSMAASGDCCRGVSASDRNRLIRSDNFDVPGKNDRKKREDMNITASDRNRLIRLASKLPKGSEERKAILTGLDKKAANLTIPIPIPYDSGLTFDEYGIEDPDLETEILKYLGARSATQLKYIGEAENSKLLLAAFSKKATLGTYDRGYKINSGSFGRMKAVHVEGYFDAFLVA